MCWLEGRTRGICDLSSARADALDPLARGRTCSSKASRGRFNSGTATVVLFPKMSCIREFDSHGKVPILMPAVCICADLSASSYPGMLDMLERADSKYSDVRCQFQSRKVDPHDVGSQALMSMTTKASFEGGGSRVPYRGQSPFGSWCSPKFPKINGFG